MVIHIMLSYVSLNMLFDMPFLPIPNYLTFSHFS